MKAIRVHEFGGPEVLRLEEMPKPSAGAGEVLVRIHASGVNPVATLFSQRDHSGETGPAVPRRA